MKYFAIVEVESDGSEKDVAEEIHRMIGEGQSMTVTTSAGDLQIAYALIGLAREVICKGGK